MLGVLDERKLKKQIGSLVSNKKEFSPTTALGQHRLSLPDGSDHSFWCLSNFRIFVKCALVSDEKCSTVVANPHHPLFSSIFYHSGNSWVENKSEDFSRIGYSKDRQIC